MSRLMSVDEKFEHWAKWYCSFCGGWHALGFGLPLQETMGVSG